MRVRRRSLVFASVVLVLTGALTGIGVAVVRPGHRAGPEGRALQLELRSCKDGVFIDGLLRCGDEVPDDLGALCPDARWTEVVRPRPGDAFVVDELCRTADPRPGGSGWSRMPPGALATLAIPIAINEAPVNELASLPGIGPKRAAAIVAARPFATIDELLDVKGIGPATLERLRSRVVLGH